MTAVRRRVDPLISPEHEPLNDDGKDRGAYDHRGVEGAYKSKGYPRKERPDIRVCAGEKGAMEEP